MLDSGFRISDLNNIPVNGKDGKFKNRIALDNTYLLSYAHTVYGINYNKQNYKIPLNSIRNDIKGYIGIESLVAPWSEQMKLWHGSWKDMSSRNKSYVYQWTDNDKLHEHYNPDKFADKSNSYFIIKDVPYPYESGELNNRDKGEKTASELNDGLAYANNSINVPIKDADPHPDTNKLVTKAYIDERLASKRLVEVGTDFYVRDYDCTYIIRAEDIRQANFDNCIKIHYPESFNKIALHNKIKFSVLVEGIWSSSENKWIPATNSDVNWKFFDFENIEVAAIWLNNNENTPVQISEKYLYDNATPLKVAGIIRPNGDSVSAMLTGSSIGYTYLLTEYISEKSNDVDSVKAQIENKDKDIFSGLPFEENTGNLSDEQKESAFRKHIESLSKKEKAELGHEIGL